MSHTPRVGRSFRRRRELFARLGALARAAALPRPVAHRASSMTTRFVNGEQNVIGGANRYHARVRPDLQLKSWLLHLSTVTIALKPPLVSADTEGGVRYATGCVQPTCQVKEVA